MFRSLRHLIHNCHNSSINRSILASQSSLINIEPDQLVQNDLDPNDSNYERFLQIKADHKVKKKEAKIRKQLQKTSAYIEKLIESHSIQLNDQERQELEQLNQIERIQFFKSKCEPFRAGIHFDDQGRPVYGLWKNSMFVHRKRNDLRQYRSYRLVDAHLTGPKLVFDFSYDQYMNAGELRNLGFQISYCISLTQTDEQNPFAVWFCNLKSNSLSDRVMKRSIGNLYQPSCHIRTMEQSYLDHVPTNKLIYLSPHAEKCMEQFEPDATYVIGAFIDQSFPKPLSHKKAQEEGIRCYRLPLDEFLNWKLGCKYLPLPQVASILIGVKNRQHWKEVLSENVRKMYQMGDEEAEEMKRRRRRRTDEDQN